MRRNSSLQSDARVDCAGHYADPVDLQAKKRNCAFSFRQKRRLNVTLSGPLEAAGSG